MTKYEIWRKHPEFNKYEVSTNGGVRRIYKNHTRKMTPTKGPDGYMYVTITQNHKGYHRPVHRLIAQTFIPNPERKKQVNHIDGNKQNNSLQNLEWVTPSENIIHAYQNNLIKPPHRKKVVCVETGEIYESIHFAGRMTGVCFANISACCRKKIKSAGGVHWRYT